MDFSESREGEAVFFEATDLTPDAVEELRDTLRRRILRYFVRHGLLDESAAEDMLAYSHEGGFSLESAPARRAQAVLQEKIRLSKRCRIRNPRSPINRH